MPNIASLLKEEIQRLSRKEVRKEIKPLQQANSRYRSDIAALKREITSLNRQINQLEKQKGKGGGKAAQSEKSRTRDESVPRFSPDWLKKHREKIGFSAADYAKLIDVSPLSIYNWESGKTTPRASQREALASVRGIGKREAQRRLETAE